MTSEFRHTQVSQEIAHHAADYFARNSNHQSLITVTFANVTPDFKDARIYFTVFPEAMEEKALDFAKRSRPEFRDYLRKHSKLPRIAHVDFDIDYGEKNRQRIDDLTRK
jgi:ribosome-binding factor A